MTGADWRIKISWLANIGAMISGGKKDRWHRLDIHMSAILGFDRRKRTRLADAILAQEKESINY